jgi:hypothetical protein
MNVSRRGMIAGLGAASLWRPAAAHAARSDTARAATVLTKAPPDPSRAPRIVEVPLPDFPDSHSVWGATGRDDSGRIWAGVSAVNAGFSARLVSVDPVSLAASVRGDVLSSLHATGRVRPGEGQIKIHSKIIPADDGYLYFSSTDEEGEVDDGSAPPRWGSHLWRVRPTDGAWEHLLAVPEGLTCAGGFGAQIYALGLWDHVLYGFDIASRNIRRTVVGSVGGHMSRNILVDRRGHAFVPRVRRPGPNAPLQTDLIEFDPALRPVAATPLVHYSDDQTPAQAHGIVGIVHLADGGMAFLTGIGHLYRVAPDGRVVALGWMHPEGPSYTASLFTWDGEGAVAGVGQRPGKPHEWLTFDLHRHVATSTTLAIEAADGLLLYGSLTRDDFGGFWLAGRRRLPGRIYRPLLIRLET